MKVCNNCKNWQPFADGFVGHIKAKHQNGDERRYVFMPHPSQLYGFCIDEPNSIEYNGNEFSYKAACYGLWESTKECKDAFKEYADKFKGSIEMQLVSIEPLATRVITIHQTCGEMIKP